MSDLRELYQEVILDHGRNPRNYAPMQDADRTGEGHNPLCGDQITVFVKLRGRVLERVTFQGSGCAISTASASMLTEAVEGRTIEEALKCYRDFHALVTDGVEAERTASGLGKLRVFAGVREFPVRVKCATLAWHTLRGALRQSEGRASTEEQEDAPAGSARERR